MATKIRISTLNVLSRSKFRAAKPYHLRQLVFSFRSISIFFILSGLKANGKNRPKGVFTADGTYFAAHQK